MKKVILSIACVLCIVSGMAQNRSIYFEPKDWKKAVAKAKLENKLIFLDCYTSWCGPCKNLAQNIFTRDRVADFYNENFINVSMDMEKDPDGVVLSRKYKPEAFPTLLFIDPFTELVVYRKVGGGTVEDILALGKTALASDNTLAGSFRKYMSGNREEDFMIKLMHDLKLAGDMERHRSVVEDFFKNLSDKQIGEKKYWELLTDHFSDPYSEVFRRIVQSRGYYESLYGAENVLTVLQWSVITELGNIANATHAGQLYERLLNLLYENPFPGSEALVIDIAFSKAVVGGDYAMAWRVMSQACQNSSKEDEIYGGFGFVLSNPLAQIMPAMRGEFILKKIAEWLECVKRNSRSMTYLARLALDRYLVYRELMDEKEDVAWKEYQQYCTMR